MKFSNVFYKIIKAVNKGTRIVVNQGGTSSTKTYSNLQALYLIAQKNPHLTISVISETMPHLKKGAMRDFINILKSEKQYSDKFHNKTESIFHVGDSIIEFFSADDSDKVHGPRRDILYMNECINIPYEVFEQLEIRTAKFILLDYNPKFKFWVHEKVLPRPNVEFIKSTYVDAKEFLPRNIIESIEARKDNRNWWRVYGLGEIGEIEGLVFPEIKQFETLPVDAQLLGYGLDFGWNNTKTALVKCNIYEDNLYLTQLIYKAYDEPKSLGTDIQKLKLSNKEIIADSQQREIIIYLNSNHALNLKPAKKGQNSIIEGIKLIKNFKIHIQKNSVELTEAFRNYMWETDKHGKYKKTPTKDNDDGIDATRYILLHHNKNRKGAIPY